MWSLPKGLKGETMLAAEKREFTEEKGHRLAEKRRSRRGKQPGGKIVHVWAVRNRDGRRTFLNWCAG
jgi:predicted NUDIX family NTP pyrophosphohydrolase